MSHYPIKNNRFYNDFDCKLFSGRRREDYRTPFQRDRDRIIHSSALRRLQAKTQVYLSGEYDFYRTRLTHSIEVAQIGRSLCNFLQQESSLLSADFFIDPDLVEAVCLAHDLGHPPFGHSGESTLNHLMRNFGGFEGNAQTLRVLTETIHPRDQKRTGMNPTRALLDGVMKYKILIQQIEQPERYFLYADQQKHLEFIFDHLPISAELSSGEQLNAFRSIECQIMDWADDTAYSLNDIIDGIHARFIDCEQLEKWGAQQSLSADESTLLENLMKKIMDGGFEKAFARKIGDFIGVCRLQERQNFMTERTNRYRFQLALDPQIRQEASLYKKIASDVVFDSPQLQQLRYKWIHILEKIFFALKENYTAARDPHPRIKLLPEITHQHVIGLTDELSRMRIICDHISGMTDRFAIRTYKRLFDPDFGSFADLI